MCMNVIDLSKSVSFVLEDIDISGQIQYITCTGPLSLNLGDKEKFTDFFLIDIKTPRLLHFDA